MKEGGSVRIPPPVMTGASLGVRTYREALEKLSVLELCEPVRLGGAGLLGLGGASFTMCEHSSKGSGRDVVEPEREMQLQVLGDLNKAA